MRIGAATAAAPPANKPGVMNAANTAELVIISRLCLGALPVHARRQEGGQGHIHAIRRADERVIDPVVQADHLSLKMSFCLLPVVSWIALPRSTEEPFLQLP